MSWFITLKFTNILKNTLHFLSHTSHKVLYTDMCLILYHSVVNLWVVSISMYFNYVPIALYCNHTLVLYQCTYYYIYITRTNGCSIFLWGTLELFLGRDIWQVWRMSHISLTKNNQCVLHRKIEHDRLYIWCWFDVFFVGLHFEIFLNKKVVPAMWSPFRDHIAGNHLKASHSM